MNASRTVGKFQFETQVSKYDLTNAWLIALIAVFGAIALMLATMLMREILPARDRIIALPPTPTGEEETLGEVEPGALVPEMHTPVFDESTFDNITDAISRVQVQFAIASTGSGNAPGDGHGDGKGRKKGVTPNPGTTDFQRWDIAYELTDLDFYTKQMRQFGIELGLVHRSTNDISRIADVGNTNQIGQSSRMDEKSSVYFVCSDRRMNRWNRAIAEAAGGDVRDAIFVHFYPEPIVQTLRALEMESLPDGKSIELVKQTHFRIITGSSGYSFEVTGYTFK